MSDETRLKICFATSEMAPFAKTGGLADVSAALAIYFDEMGHDLRLLMPMYPAIDTSGLTLTIVPELQGLQVAVGGQMVDYDIVQVSSDDFPATFYMLRCPALFHGDSLYGGYDEHVRFTVLSRASIEMCQCMSFAPDIFHVHDWHTALVPLYLKTLYHWDDLFRDTKTVLTIHNIGYQGVFGNHVLADIGLDGSTALLDPEDLYYGRINFMKAGVMHADLLTTVSPTYAREIMEPEYGMGLQHALRARHGALVGILNGVDYEEWDPKTDPLIPHSYSPRRMAGKERNKKALMDTMGLEYRAGRPLFGMVTRLTYQKGIELVQRVLPDLMRNEDFALIALGSGEHDYEQFFEQMLREFPGRIAFYQGFNNALAHQIEAGSDVFLMPSRYEPCGLNQMYSLRYGTVPLVRATGGLADSVAHFDPKTGEGTGVVFHDYDANGLRWAMTTALKLFANKHAWKQLVFNGMQQDFSWTEQGRLYLQQFHKLLNHGSA
ncbi:MAG: glycogen synthase GlgA [Xanthomonadales bacterium]|nr:glycogen synthase GlgA [Gammaproteobacteria bacterium]NNL05393.1 glycogen synthase GlgA [Xanthomonadales bacterium]